MTPPSRRWTFLTNHGHTLVCIARDPDARLRDIAEHVGITERAAQAIVGDLVAEGFLTRQRIGRRNRYRIDRSRALRHALEAEATIGAVLDVLLDGAPGTGPAGEPPASGVLRRPASA